jgi:hypothetical protein
MRRGRETTMVTIALSGPDNVGKTTHLRLLADRTRAISAGPLDDHDPRWENAKDHGLSVWWFTAAPVEEVVDVLACSYLRRAEHCASLPTDSLVLVDRGMSMLEASVVATVATRDHLDYRSASERAADLLAPYSKDIAQARVAEREVLILHDHDIQQGVGRALDRGWSVTPEYAYYQQVLQTHLHANPAAQTALVAGSASIMDVHHELCVRLNQAGVTVPVPSITGINVVALGGLSESGKSTAGAHLHDVHHFDRLKIGYLLGLAAARHGIDDVNALDPMRTAELLVVELDRYTSAHHYQRWVSIESLHGVDLATSLRALLGNQLTVLYLDVIEQTRKARGTAGADDVTARDITKKSRGADRIHAVADAVVDNNGAAIELKHNLDRVVRTRMWPTRQPVTTTVPALGLPGHLSRYLDRMLQLLADPSDPVISLLAITGSGSRGKYQQGWSDLDVFAIADTGRIPEVRTALNTISRDLESVKLGFTVITLDECRAGTLTSRLTHVVASIANGTNPVLWSAPGLELPEPDDVTVTSAKWVDATMAAVEIRRLLIRKSPDLRALYKVTALLAKIIMKGEGSYYADDRDALEAFLGITGQPSADLDGARANEIAGIRLANSVVSWWLTSVSGGAR